MAHEQVADVSTLSDVPLASGARDPSVTMVVVCRPDPGLLHPSLKLREEDGGKTLNGTGGTLTSSGDVAEQLMLFPPTKAKVVDILQDEGVVGRLRFQSDLTAKAPCPYRSKVSEFRFVSCAYQTVGLLRTGIATSAQDAELLDASVADLPSGRELGLGMMGFGDSGSGLTALIGFSPPRGRAIRISVNVLVRWADGVLEKYEPDPPINIRVPLNQGSR